jgi:hypothetical protein
MKKYTFLILTILVLFIVSCETDFDTIAAYEDITVVYGLLDSKDTNQYIKINKAFLSENNILTYAADPDSNQYLVDELDVKIIEKDENGNTVQTFDLDTTTIYNKESGQFYYPEQIIFNWTKPQFPYEVKYIIEGLNDTVGIEFFWLNEQSSYFLNVTNTVTGKEITSETPLVKDFRITKPGFGQTIRFVPNPINPKEFEWEKADNGGKYEFELRFNYGEWFWGSQDTVYKYITLATTTLSGSGSGSTMSYFYLDDNFFTSCENLIPYDADKESEVRERYSGKIDVLVSVAEEDLALYMEVNEPSTSIVQEKPEFTNIENGIGIFSSRYRKVKSKKLHSESVSELKNLPTDLKFQF